MTETAWLTSVTPRPMFDFIKSKTSARKLQLVAAGCCRLIGAQFDDDRMMGVIETVERHAEGEATADDWRDAVHIGERLGIEGMASEAASRNLPHPQSAPAARIALRALVSSPPADSLGMVLNWTQASVARIVRPWGAHRPPIREALLLQADLFREIIGNPFLERTVVPEWMTTGGSVHVPGWMIRVSETAKLLADGIHADQAFERLPILADALEEAGCTDTDLLLHMREPGAHVRGCWALDLVLGKG